MKKLKKEIVIRYLKEKRCMAIGDLTAEMILKQINVPRWEQKALKTPKCPLKFSLF